MRTFAQIAEEIIEKWANPSPYALPYIKALRTIHSTEPSASYGVEDASEQVMRFLANASGWRGNDARRIKAELKVMIGM